MCRIDRLRCYQRKNIGNEVFTKLLLFGFAQVLIRFNVDAMFGKFFEDLRKQLARFRFECADSDVAFLDLLSRRTTVDGEILHADTDL